MYRPGTDPDNVEMSDVLCDFCHSPWTADLPVIEGHQGSVICGKCVRVACLEVGPGGGHEAHGGESRGGKCRMCLEEREEPCWASPLDESARICLRCIEMAAEALESDPDIPWRRPA